MPKKPQRKFKPYMSKAAVIRPAIEDALRPYEWFLDDAEFKKTTNQVTAAAVKAMRDYDRWLQRGGD